MQDPQKPQNPDLTNFPNISHSTGDLSIEINCREAREYTKTSYPIKYGLFSRLETPDLILEFNLNHEIKQGKSKSRKWIHPQEWLKRTMGNDWVYYSTGGYAGVFESIGEYYLPNLMYKTNSLLGGKPLEMPEVAKIHQTWDRLLADMAMDIPAMPHPVAEWVQKILKKTPAGLARKADQLFEISGARATVLPPDARHSDYDIIPLTIADGCLYKCKFCKVKNKKSFAPRSKKEILTQLEKLKSLYAEDLINYNGLFLGEHDALAAPGDLILYAARTAYETLNFGRSYMEKPMLYFFGSVDGLLNAEDSLFKELNALPFHTCINIGLESADNATLETLGKPITASKVVQAFGRAQVINQTHDRVEMTCNFVMDEDLPEAHTQTMLDLVREKVPAPQTKGSIYLSPLQFGRPSREVLFDFYHLKTKSRLPMFLYIIQRL